LIITNDFPPRQGGIETFVREMATRFPADGVVVYTSRTPGGPDYDRTLPFPVDRADTSVLLPTPQAVRRAQALIARYDCDSVWFGSSVPLGLMAATLRSTTGASRFVATTHGHELWWAGLPGTRQVLRRVARSCDAITYIADYMVDRLAPAVGPGANWVKMSPAVEASVFDEVAAEGPGGPLARQARRRWGLGEGPVVVCAGRLVKRKGQDVVLQAWRRVLARYPEARLLIVGKGPQAASLRELAASLGLGRTVRFTGGLPWESMRLAYAAGSVFVGPSRNRYHGLQVEGLGIVYLEAAACGLPVVVGADGGAPETVRQAETGFVVDPTSPRDVGAAIVALLSDPAMAARMGRAGRAWVREAWGWGERYRTLATLLGRGDELSDAGTSDGGASGSAA
jgi:phosphatidylinositol alpha-1,6-mannosyltransferase